MAITSQLLPNGKQQFLDPNGDPIADGTVGFYIPTTMTLKNVWSDPGQTVALANPVALDSAGEAIIYGAGQYRQIVIDVHGNTIWDELTQANGPFPIWGGTSTGGPNAQVVTAGNWTQQDGEQISFRAGFSNTAATTLQIGATVYPVSKNGSAGPTALTGGEIIAGNIVTGAFDPVSGAIVIGTNASFAGAGGQLTNIASGATVDLGTAPSHNVNITGNTGPITSFGSAASVTSPYYYVTFASNPTLTHSSTLLLPGQANIPTNPGDALLAEYLGAGAWKVVEYSPQAGPPQPVFGQCRLGAVTATQVALTPFQGNVVSFPNGTSARIPSGGVLSDPTNCYLNGVAGQVLVASTLYYGYLWNAGTVAAPNWVIDWSATGHSTDANSGIEIKTGDPTRVLIGMAYPGAGPVFVNSTSSRLVLSWFNQRKRALMNQFSTARTSSSTVLVEINAEIRCQFLTWGSEAIPAAYLGDVKAASTVAVITGPGLDGTAASLVTRLTADIGGETSNSAAVAGAFFVGAEGYHYITELGQMSSAVAVTWNFSGVDQLNIVVSY